MLRKSISSFSRTDLLLPLGLTLGVLGLVYFHTLFFTIRVPRDAGTFLTIGDAVRAGKIPYRDIIDHKPPGIYYTLAAALSLHRSVYAARVTLLLFNTGTAALLIYTGYRWAKLRAGLVAAGIYLACLTLYEGVWVLTEQFVAFWSMLAFISVLRGHEQSSDRLLIVAGSAAGIACLYKQTGLLTVGGIGLYLLISDVNLHNGTPIPDLQVIRGYVFGVTIPFAVVSLYFATQGAFGDLVYWTILANESYSGTDFAPMIEILRLQIRQARIVWFAAIVGLLVTIYRRDSDARELIVFLFTLSLLPLLIRQYGHYFIQILPFAAILAAYALEDIVAVVQGWLGEETSPTSVAMVVFVLALFLSLPFVSSVASQRGVATGFTLSTQEAVTSDIQDHASPGDRVLIVTAEPQYYFLTDRPLADERNVYYLPINRNKSYTTAGIVDLVASDPPAVVLLRGCNRSPEICKAVKEDYSQQASHPRGITIWTPTHLSNRKATT